MKVSVKELQGYKVFPFANLFPLLTNTSADDALLALAQDIFENGQRTPITIWEGQLLDGRNRLAALELAEVKDAEITEFYGTEQEATAFVISANLQRRQMCTHEKVVAAVTYNQQVGLQEAAKTFRLSENTLRSAIVIHQHRDQHPILWTQVSEGKLGVSPAYAKLREYLDNTEQKVEKIRQFPEILNEYREGAKNLHEAYQASQKAEAEEKAVRRKVIPDATLHLKSLLQNPLWEETALQIGKLNCDNGEIQEFRKTLDLVSRKLDTLDIASFRQCKGLDQ